MKEKYLIVTLSILSFLGCLLIPGQVSAYNKSHTVSEFSYMSELKDFRWIGEENETIEPSTENIYTYPLEFFNNDNEKYIPSIFDFEYELERADGEFVFMDWSAWMDFDYDKMSGEVQLVFHDIDNIYGNLVLKVTHLESGKSISKTIHAN